jgi:hypothetical protein
MTPFFERHSRGIFPITDQNGSSYKRVNREEVVIWKHERHLGRGPSGASGVEYVYCIDLL